MDDYLLQIFSLKGRVAIVNGASSLLGKTIIKGLTQSGAVVCGVDSCLLKLNQPANDGDRQYSQFQVICDQLNQKYRQFNLLINIVEVHTPSVPMGLLTAREDAFRQGIEMQFAQAKQASKFAVQSLKKSGGGSIVNIIDLKNPIGVPDDFSYIATKNNLLMITKELAVSFIRDNVRINNLVIGHVANPTGQTVANAQSNTRFRQNLIATTIYFATENSSSITGQDLFLVSNNTKSYLDPTLQSRVRLKGEEKKTELLEPNLNL